MLESIVIKAPARINLIGEHIDYNGGMVLPAAIDRYITLQFNSRDDRMCSVQSSSMSNNVYFSLDHLPPKTNSWHDYVIGILHIIREKTQRDIQGFSCKIDSDIPNGAGLSSSAALSCGLASGVNALQNLHLSKEQIIQIGIETEHRFIGTQCGMMDQFAVTMGKSQQAMLLNCQTKRHTPVPISLTNHQFLLVDSRVKHTLVESDYNNRREECQEALAIIQSHGISVDFLVDITPHQLDAVKNKIPLTLQNRVEFVINEQRRTIMAAEYLQNNQFPAFGRLMYQSHRGLQHLYEVTCMETDLLVNEAQQQPYILGARQMGGGFGGCVLYVIEKDAIPTFKERTYKSYKTAFNLDPIFYDLTISDGIHIETFQ